MDLRDWLIVVGVVIITGILLDGYRRMRLAKMDSLKMSRDMGGELENTPLDDYNPELPGGGARIVSKGDDSSDEMSSESGADGALNVNALDDFELEADAPIVADKRIETEPEFESGKISTDRFVNVELNDVPVAHAGKRELDENVDSSQDKAGAAQEVFVINVDSKSGQAFKGEALKTLLEACGMDHGEMSIFHRHEEDDLLSPIQFSVANAVEPGYFDPDKILEMSTPGVSFFMSLPGPKDYMKAFDYMLETAQCFARNLDGELRDENRSVMTAQTIEHCRQRIREYERKQLSSTRV